MKIDSRGLWDDDNTVYTKAFVNNIVCKVLMLFVSDCGSLSVVFNISPLSIIIASWGFCCCF
jgi:hypothetical protein